MDRDQAAAEVVGAEQDPLPGQTHCSMAEGSWRHLTPGRDHGEAGRGATASPSGTVDAASTGQVQHSGLSSLDPAWGEMSGAVATAGVEEQVLHLAIRKQVSYR